MVRRIQGVHIVDSPHDMGDGGHPDRLLVAGALAYKHLGGDSAIGQKAFLNGSSARPSGQLGTANSVAM